MYFHIFPLPGVNLFFSHHHPICITNLILTGVVISVWRHDEISKPGQATG
jgi:hypothetical protein